MAVEGVQVEVTDGFARIEFPDPHKRGEVVAALLKAGGPGLIDVDTRGSRRRAYIVPESIAQQAGLLEEAAAEAPAYPEGQPSEDWTIPQLKAYAEHEGIDLGTATKKADILTAINGPAPVDEAAVDSQPEQTQ